MDSLLNALMTALAALLTLVTSGDHQGPQIRAWDGTTLRLEWDGSIYTAICKSSTGIAGAGATVTYPKCELPPIASCHQYGNGTTRTVGPSGTMALH